jgi:hypothetical protein
MKLVEVVVNTDWKCRASHRVKILAEGTLEELVVKLDEAVTAAKRQDLLSDVDDDNEGGYVHLLEKLDRLTPEEIAKLWEDKERWEMELDDDGLLEDGLRQRMLCGSNGEGDSWSVSYSILVD